ncbi:serine hydrolase, partial [Acinetobacter baumannii]|uniref:serine hydrolase n=1 Tax=Acinetobacter baumannii TaxID=470 RepID=UPI00300C6B8D
GSVSKLFVWTAVMQLVEQGKLDLDKNINAYLDFKVDGKDGAPITLRLLMTHRAGFEEHVKNLIGRDPKLMKSLADYERDNLPARIFAPRAVPA